jgi:hypothetical protein
LTIYKVAKAGYPKKILISFDLIEIQTGSRQHLHQAADNESRKQASFPFTKLL